MTAEKLPKLLIFSNENGSIKILCRPILQTLNTSGTSDVEKQSKCSKHFLCCRAAVKSFFFFTKKIQIILANACQPLSLHLLLWHLLSFSLVQCWLPLPEKGSAASFRVMQTPTLSLRVVQLTTKTLFNPFSPSIK